LTFIFSEEAKQMGNLVTSQLPDTAPIKFPNWDQIEQDMTAPTDTKESLQDFVNKRFEKSAAAIIWIEIKDKPFLSEGIPFLKELALQARHTLLLPLQHLQPGDVTPITLTRKQCATLLALAFFGYPFTTPHHLLDRFQFNLLRDRSKKDSKQKRECWYHYFVTLARDSRRDPSDPARIDYETGRVTFLRLLPERDRLLDHVYPLVPVQNTPGAIEDTKDALQVDFANRNLGGGVLGHGSVQEEILFSIHPECCVGILLHSAMNDKEAIAIIGARRFSTYSGYSRDFKWTGAYDESFQYDSMNRLKRCLLAMDAKDYSKQDPRLQYQESEIKRELIKASAGFCIPDAFLGWTPKGIATGNWGAGVFSGDVHLKFCIQWIAASIHNRPLLYHAFGNSSMASLDTFVQQHHTTADLWQYILRYKGGMLPP
jgi:poly(ADP-ribose) glycohydrolase